MNDDRNPDNGRKWKDSCAVAALAMLSAATLIGTGIAYLWHIV